MCRLTGYCYLHRSVWQWAWHDEPATNLLWIYLFSMANYKDVSWHDMIVQRGQLVTSVRTIHEDTGLSTQQIVMRLKRLEQEGMINVRATNKYSVVTICNYDSYQNQNNTNNKQTTNEQQTENNQSTTINNNNNNNNNIDIVDASEKIFNEDKLDFYNGNDTEESIDYFHKRVIENERWAEYVANEYRMPRDRLLELLSRFCVQKKSDGIRPYLRKSDFIKHFKNWLVCIINSEKNERAKIARNSGQYAQQQDIERSRRKGVDATADASEYTTTF